MPQKEARKGNAPMTSIHLIKDCNTKGLQYQRIAAPIHSTAAPAIPGTNNHSKGQAVVPEAVSLSYQRLNVAKFLKLCFVCT